MKKYFSSKTLIALVVAIAATAGYESQIHAQPMPPPANANALPAGIQPGTPAAEVVKLAQAGVDAGVIKNYIAGCPSAFNLDADQIIALTDAGVSTDMVNAMIAHDKNLSVAVAQPPAPSPAPVDNANSAPPATEMTVNEFNDTLTPYGQWVEVEGYGRCWRPTIVVYDSTWQPYCDRGHWVYTDCGWYWDSDYSWGVTFHYGRWFHHDHFGWCWWPDTVWAPSWVTWRSSDAYCGWAPLPPFAVYRPGFGFFYRGAGVAIGFDFGLSADCYTFVPFGHFNESHPRYYREEAGRARQIFNQTTVINNYSRNNTFIVNGGIAIDRIRGATHRPLEPVAVGSLPNAGRQGWRGDTAARPDSGQQLRHGPVLRNDRNNDLPATHRQGSGSPVQPPNRNENAFSPAHSQPNANPSARNNNNNPAPAGNDRVQSQNRNSGAPVISPPPPRTLPQVEQRQVIAPVAPEHPSLREQPVEPRIEPHQNPILNSPRVAPSSPPPSRVPVQSQSDSSDHGSDKDRQNR
jgi:hypothetical protein